MITMKFIGALLLVATVAFVAVESILGSSANNRILGGTNAPAGSANYHAHLQMRAQPTDVMTRVGSGSLISTQHILTSASNIRNFGWWNVGLGSRTREQLQWHESTRGVAHPLFNPDTLEHNIGVIFLASALSTSASLSPVTMPSMAQMSRPLVNEEGRVAGFGLSTPTGTFAGDLQRSAQNVAAENVCTSAYPHLGQFIEGTIFCTETTTSNICGGDQGAGFVIDILFQPVLLGVASFTDQECRAGSPAIYTRINQYRDWVQEQTGINW